MPKRDWIWPEVGPTPVNQGFDTETFDREDFPYSETFVREAIQNSLDARLDPNRPVEIRFGLHEAPRARIEGLISDVIDCRRKVGLPIPPEWGRGTAHWLTIEDFNSKGLGGDLQKRSSDFWNYWLNFGITNKDGSGRGGRGIGRVTLLIASRIATVVALTRRNADGRTAACGMAVLRAKELDDGKFRATHAYLAESVDGSIYRLLDTPAFHDELCQSFGFAGYRNPAEDTGLALAILYPHDEISPKGILASAIEHFAPAILARTLAVTVDGRRLDHSTIDEIASEVGSRVRAKAISENAARYLRLVREAMAPGAQTLSVRSLMKEGLEALDRDQIFVRLREQLRQDGRARCIIELPLNRNGRSVVGRLSVAFGIAGDGFTPIDRFFREGMCLPDVKAGSPGDLDMIMLCETGELGTYLNFCEGKAHLDLLENKEVKAKLAENGFEDGPRVRRFVKNLPDRLRRLIVPEITEPDGSVFESFFSLPDENRPGPGGGPERPRNHPPRPEPGPSPNPKELVVTDLEDGFSIAPSPSFHDWPISVRISVAYADGTRNPDWSPHDFELRRLNVEHDSCEISFEKNRIRALNCTGSFRLKVTGFDRNRELEIRLRRIRDAAEN